MPEITYRIIGFGENDYGFFNQFNFASNLNKATEIYNNLYEDPEIDGAVMIETFHESWKIIDRFGAEGTSVICGPLFTFKVEKSPQLSIV